MTILLDDIYSAIQEASYKFPNIKEIVLNGGFTGVWLDDDTMGVAMNVRSGVSGSDEDVEALHFLIGQDTREAVTRLSGQIDAAPEGTPQRYLHTSVLVALYNALSQPFVSPDALSAKGYSVVTDSRIGPPDLVRPGETVTIVGFGGLVRPISRIAKKTYVTELEPSLFTSMNLSQRGLTPGPTCAYVVPAGEARACFAKSDCIFVTGCALVTGTMDEILSLCEGKKVIVYGSTAAFIPAPLFDRGVNSVHASRVTNPALMADFLLNCGGAVERFFPQAGESYVVEYVRAYC